MTKSKRPIRIAAYVSLLLGVPIGAWLSNSLTATAIVVLIYMLLLVPIGILRMVDFYRTNDGTTLFGCAFNALFRVPLALFGLVSLVIGMAIIVWVLYNVFVERQRQYTGPRFILGLGSFGIGAPLVVYGWVTLRSAVRRIQEVTLSPDGKQESDGEAREDR